MARGSTGVPHAACGRLDGRETRHTRRSIPEGDDRGFAPIGVPGRRMVGTTDPKGARRRAGRGRVPNAPRVAQICRSAPYLRVEERANGRRGAGVEERDQQPDGGDHCGDDGRGSTQAVIARRHASRRVALVCRGRGGRSRGTWRDPLGSDEGFHLKPPSRSRVRGCHGSKRAPISADRHAPGSARQHERKPATTTSGLKASTSRAQTERVHRCGR
jgi:hypothetical protein